MKKFDIRLSANSGANIVIELFESAVMAHNLTIKSRGTLNSISGSVHWHITNAGQSGTLEATFDRNRFRLWLCYHDNRHADWIDEAVRKIKKTLESS